MNKTANTKYRASLPKEVEEWVSENGLMYYGGATVKDFTTYFGMAFNTFKKWRERYPAFDKAIVSGQQKFKRNKAHKLVLTLAKAAEGYVVEDSQTVTKYIPNAEGEPQVREQIRTQSKRNVKPDIGAAIFLLTNLDPEHYQNRQRNEVAIHKDSDRDMTIEEINAEIARLEQFDKK